MSAKYSSWAKAMASTTRATQIHTSMVRVSMSRKNSRGPLRAM